MQKRTFEEVKNETKLVTNGEYILNSERFRQTSKRRNHEYEFFHTICGKSSWKTYRNFFVDGYRCIHCSKKRPYIDTDIFKKRLDEKYPGEFDVLEDYVNAYTPILLHHKKCGTIRKYTPKHLINENMYCKICNNKKLLNMNFGTQLLEQTNNEFCLISEYTGRLQEVTILHTKCNKSFINTPANLQRALKDFGFITCPNCKKGYVGENMIRDFLNQNNIEFKEQYAFDDCKNIHVLKFDFAIINNNKVIGLIEFDGPQHYDKKSKYAKLNSFDDIIKRDNIKNEYCKLKNIKLLRIRTFNKKELIQLLQNFIKSL